MKLKVKRKEGILILIDEDSGCELFIAAKHLLNNAYRIIDYRYTDKETEATEYLYDLCSSSERISYEFYLENKKLFNFPIKIIENRNRKHVVWRSLNGIVVNNSDKKDEIFSFRTELHQWSYRGAQLKLKEAKEYWKNYTGDLNDPSVKIKNENFRFYGEDIF